MLIPISADRVALAFNQWCTIHASADTPGKVAEQLAAGHVAVRAVCGSDVHPYIVSVGVEASTRPMIMPWPPPPGLRCVDCERILGKPRPTRGGGWGTWDTLRPAGTIEVAS
jgi:hypothetical protein